MALQGGNTDQPDCGQVGFLRPNIMTSYRVLVLVMLQGNVLKLQLDVKANLHSNLFSVCLILTFLKY